MAIPQDATSLRIIARDERADSLGFRNAAGCGDSISLLQTKDYCPASYGISTVRIIAKFVSLYSVVTDPARRLPRQR
jgi:hypothetical protein